MLCEARVSIVLDTAAEELATILKTHERRNVPEYISALPVVGGVDREALVAALQSTVTDRIADGRAGRGKRCTLRKPAGRSLASAVFVEWRRSASSPA